jgi:hypothetical protein
MSKMKIKSNFICFLLVLIFITSCGYKKTNLTLEKTFSINNLNIIGVKNIDYIIRNKLNLYANENSANLLDIKITISKEKGVKEKKSNNQINKYFLRLNFIGSVIERKTNKKFIFNKTNTTDFKKEETVINTRKNEDYKLKTTAEELTEEFIEFLTLNLN